MEITKSELCTGCHACFSVCPRHCITMQPNGEGFSYPIVDGSLCIECHRCQKVCPVNQSSKAENNGIHKAFAVSSKDACEKRNSSSGGIFSLLCRQVLQEGGVVVGAAFDESYRSVRHRIVSSYDEIGILRGAKYSQSDIGDCFIQIKELLRSHQKVLFVGTPCQTEGLVSFLGGKSDDLLLVDMICHGVPSPLVWRTYLNARVRQYGTEPIFVSFRDKSLGWKMYSVKMYFANGKHYQATHYEDLFMRGFIYKDLYLRESCYACSFKKENRVADLTLGDLWGAGRFCPDWDDDSGLSMILVHSDKGMTALEKVFEDADGREIDFDEAVKANPAVTASARRPSERDAFFAELEKADMIKLLKRYCGLTFLRKVKHRIKKHKIKRTYRYHLLQNRNNHKEVLQ